MTGRSALLMISLVFSVYGTAKAQTVEPEAPAPSTTAPAPEEIQQPAQQASPEGNAQNKESAASEQSTLPPVEVVTETEPAAPPKPAVQKKASKQTVPSKPQAAKASTPPAQQTSAPAAAVSAPDSSDGGSSSSGGEANAFAPVKGYVATRSASGTKTDTPLSEIPQGITVVGREQMEDQGVQSLQEAVRYSPSVVADLYGEDTRNDGFAIRGQEATEQFLDGMRRFYGNYLNAPRIEPYGLERIEILRGPSAMLYGQSGVGGTVNMVSKRPQDEFGGEIGVTYGSHDSKDVRFDVTGPATADGMWTYRLVGLGRDADTQVDFVPNDRLFLAPSLTFRPSVDTSFTLLGNVGRDRSGSTVQFLPHEGTLFAGPHGFIPINRFVGEPDIDHYDADTWSVTLLADHKIDETWSVYQGLRYSHSDISYAQIFPYLPDRLEPFLDADRRTIGRDLSFSENDTKTFTSDTNATAKFDLGASRHKFLFGFDYSRADVSRVRDTGVTDCNVFDLYAPVYGQFEPCDFDLNPLGGIPVETLPDRAQWQSGLYAQDQIRLGSWIAVLGLRKDWTATETVGDPDEKADALTRRAGLMYELPFGLTPYISYAESFVPVAGSDFFNRPFRPLEGESFEVGFKYQVPGTSFIVNSAIFDATEQNRLAEDPEHIGFSVQSAEVSLRGFEIEARGDVTENIKIIAGYSYLQAEHVAGDQAGFRVESLPEHIASLWAVYTFHDGMLEGFSFGGGVRYNGSSWDGYDIVETPSFTLFDAMLAYETDSWRWSLNATNLEDDYYATTCLNRGDCFLGAGREITTGLTYKF